MLTKNPAEDPEQRYDCRVHGSELTLEEAENCSCFDKTSCTAYGWVCSVWDAYDNQVRLLQKNTPAKAEYKPNDPYLGLTLEQLKTRADFEAESG